MVVPQKTGQESSKFESKYFPLHLGFLTVGENLMPMGNWTVISKNPFRFLIAMGVGNHSWLLLKKFKEAAMHFMPWSERERVVKAGFISGRDVNKADLLNFKLVPADKLDHTKLIEGADNIFELVVHSELKNISREFAPFVMDVVAVHGVVKPLERQPILFLSEEDFATMGERWEYRR